MCVARVLTQETNWHVVIAQCVCTVGVEKHGNHDTMSPNRSDEDASDESESSSAIQMG